VGDEIREILKDEGVRESFVRIQGTTRMSVTVTQTRTSCQTRLSFPGPVISRDEAERLESQIKKLHASSILMCGGSLPEAYPIKRVAKLMAIAQKKRIPVIIDCPGKILRPLLKDRPTLIKPNLVEFQDLLGKSLRSTDAVVSAALGLSRFVRLICVSSVDGGALLVTKNGTWYGKGKKIKKCSTVGAGDSMVAGMLYQLASELSHQEQWDDLAPELLRWGIAAGMATASKPTGALGQAADIRLFARAVSIKKIS
jgi:1-phosphofructokinase family hexose kinase